MKRVLFVMLPPYLPGTITGSSVSVDALCRRLKTSGIEPLVACGLDRVQRAPGAPLPQLGYTVLRLADPIAAMLEIMDRLEPDAVVVYGAQSAARAVALTASRPRPLHLYFTAMFLGYPAPPAGSAPHLRYAVNSDFLATFGQAFLGFAPALVPPLFEPDDYRCEPKGDAILFVNPIASKGAHLVGAIARRLPHRRFLIVRSRPDQSLLAHVSMALPNVEWQASMTDMRPIYARTKLVLMPTIVEEGWGRTVSEAQISGIPAIVSDRGGLPDTVGPGGIVMPLAEPVDRWCQAIESLMSDESRYAGVARAALQHSQRPELAPAAVMQRFVQFVQS